MTQYYREISERIKSLTGQFPAIVLTGARQTGKTTLLKAAFPEHRYVSLDLPSLAELAERRPAEFLEAHPLPLIVDEVQYAPALFRHIKLVIDQDRHANGRFILTGSQKFVLMKGVAESLAGRVAVLELETLSFQELAQAASRPDNATDWVNILVRGGFPDLWRDPTIDRNAYYRSYLSTYLERDVRQILNVTSLRDFERFVRACAARSGQLLDKAGLARDVGISAKASNDWLSVLEASNQIQLLEPYFENIGKRLVKSPKLYFSDTGLLCFLLGLDESALLKSPYLGTVWEAAVFAELRKRREAAGGRSTLWYYRDAQQKEVDFIVADGNARHLIEAKWTEAPGERDTGALKTVVSILRERGVAPEVNPWVVCRVPHPTVSSDGTRVVGIQALMDHLWDPAASKT
jgi:uncharacterized protein